MPKKYHMYVYMYTYIAIIWHHRIQVIVYREISFLSASIAFLVYIKREIYSDYY